MEHEPKVDLKQYIPKKGSKRYIVKIIVYVAVLLFLIYLLMEKNKEEKISDRPLDEIEGVSIILNDEC
jgi:hypothetical protein